VRYYCKNCEAETSATKQPEHCYNYQCPICLCAIDWDKVVIPDFETPEQYQKRTGKDLPDDGLVWVKDGLADEQGWRADFFWNALDDQRGFIVCVNGPLPPPNDWRPE